MSRDSAPVRFLYGTGPGRALLALILRCRLDRPAASFLRSRFSRPLIPWYARRHGIALTREELATFATFQDFFARTRPPMAVDVTPEHLISPCDGWLSACPISADSVFFIKGSRYRLTDLLEDGTLSRQYHGGDCLIFRLVPSDYHHYCYIDDACRGEDHPIPGALHSVQPAACAAYPVYTLNRRCWTPLETDRFGLVTQIEVGALMVGGIVSEPGPSRVRRGEEMGHFELAGSTVVLLFQRDRIRLRPHIARALARGGEYRVEQGAWIGCQVPPLEGGG